MLTTRLGMAATAFDIRHPELIAHDLAQVSRRLRSEAETPESVLALVGDLAEDIGEVEVAAVPEIPTEAWAAIQKAALRAVSAIRHDEEPERRRRLRLLIEELRFRLERLAEHEQVSDERTAEEIVRWLDRNWTVPQRAKAELFGVSERTWQRWVADEETSAPSGEQDRIVRLVARVVGELRFLLTANGSFAWLTNERADFDGQTPLDVIRTGEPEPLQSLFALVARARAGAVT